MKNIILFLIISFVCLVNTSYSQYIIVPECRKHSTYIYRPYYPYRPLVRPYYPYPIIVNPYYPYQPYNPFIPRPYPIPFYYTY